MKEYKELSLNDQLIMHGIETIRENPVKLRYNGKTIIRPSHDRCKEVVLSKFCVNIKLAPTKTI